MRSTSRRFWSRPWRDGQSRSSSLAGDALDEHEVHERAWLVVIDGQVEVVVDLDGETVSGGAGLLAEFDPNERREVRATKDSRVLLILTPWPGEGHPSQR